MRTSGPEDDRVDVAEDGHMAMQRGSAWRQRKEQK